MKKLKIQFWKAEKALAMQILEQEGLPKEKEGGFIKIIDSPSLSFETGVWLRGCHHYADFELDAVYFSTNSERDAYLDKVRITITDELFTGEGELKVGEMCEVWNLEFKEWQERKLLAILPENYEERFIVANLHYPNRYVPFSDARPISKRIEPTIEECGNVITYTWEQ